MKLKNIFSLLNTITVLIMLTLFLLLSVAIRGTNNEIERVIHTHEVIVKAENLMSNMVNQETGMRGFLATGNQGYLEPYNKALGSFDSEINILKNTISDNPAQIEQLSKIANLADQWHTKAADVYLSIKREILDANIRLEEIRGISNSGEDKEKMDKIRDLLLNVEDENTRLKLLISMLNMETGVRAYIINKEEDFLDPYYEGLDEVNIYINNTNVVGLRDSVDDWIENVAQKQIVLVRESLAYNTEEHLYTEISKGEGKKIMDQIRSEIDYFIEVEENLLLERNLKLDKLQDWSIIAIVISAVLAIIIVIIQYLVIKKITTPLTEFTKHMSEFDPENSDEDIIIDSSSIFELRELAVGYVKLLGELKSSQEELYGLTRTDQLTLMKNRRWLDENLDLEWRRAMRSSKPLTILMIDIDYFKNFNDTYGHVAGDECLKRVANTVLKCLKRPMDNAIRFGGEEFAVILPETDTDGGLIVAEEIRSSVEALGIENNIGSKDAVLTVSIGIASDIPIVEQDVKELLDNSDKAMYEAKYQGRNRCHIFRK